MSLGLVLLLAAEPALYVGGHAHGAANIAALAELGLGNFVWIPKVGYSMGNTPWDAEHEILADVDACLAHGLAFMISQRRGLGTEVRPGGFEYGGDCSGDLHPPETVAEIVRRAGPRFIGLHAEELDADLVQSAVRPIFRTRLPELYAFTDRAGGRAAFEAELVRQRDIAHAAGAAYLPNLCVTHHHSGFRTGADLVIAEFFEHLPTTELQLAYLRGGALQFGRPWGVWVSPWFWGQVPCDDKELWPAAQAQPGGGHSAAALRRALYLAWVSGARLLTVQETEPLFSRDGDGWKLAAWGAELKSFWEVARERPEPMRPIVPLALLVDADGGWAPGHLWQDWNEQESVWGKLPAERSDAGLAGLLDALLPGFARTREAVIERRDGYPGYFAATPLGPFDLVASDVSAEVLADYPAVALAGSVRWTPALREVLHRYVTGGGRLLLNALHLIDGERLVDDPALTGVRLQQRIEAAQRVVFADGVTLAEPWYAHVASEPAGAEVLARDEQERPVVYRHAVGAGEVWLATPEYLLAGWVERTRPLSLGAELLRRIAREPPVAVEGSDLSWVAARQGDEVVVCVANHSPEDRTAVLRAGEVVREVEVGGEDVALVRLAR